MSASGGKRAVIAALLANLGIAVTKFLAFALTGSSSMLAEAIHSVADSGNQVLLLVGGKRATRQATPRHPFGYGRERYIYAFIVAIVLFSVGGVFAVYEGIHKVVHPEPIDAWQWVPIVVLVVAITLESLSFRTAIAEANQVRRDVGWVGFIRHARAPELPVILLEDFGALVGLVFALFGVGLTLITHNGIWDGVGTLCIGALLISIAIVLAIETKSLLLGESATAQQIDAIAAALAAAPGLDRVIHLRTMHLGPDELLIGAKLAIRPGSSAREIAAAIDDAEARVRAAVPIARVIYLEPDIDRGPEDQTVGTGSAGC
ncbi:MAG TPA: cation diffusion facilitator family transporter [Micromonosporaceae bacterium]|nr:cation diffusion facilitator family transporter [Micromonosporaceae bacterium]